MRSPAAYRARRAIPRTALSSASGASQKGVAARRHTRSASCTGWLSASSIPLSLPVSATRRKHRASRRPAGAPAGDRPVGSLGRLGVGLGLDLADRRLEAALLQDLLGPVRLDRLRPDLLGVDALDRVQERGRALDQLAGLGGEGVV